MNTVHRIEIQRRVISTHLSATAYNIYANNNIHYEILSSDKEENSFYQNLHVFANVFVNITLLCVNNNYSLFINV